MSVRTITYGLNGKSNETLIQQLNAIKNMHNLEEVSIINRSENRTSANQNQGNGRSDQKLDMNYLKFEKLKELHYEVDADKNSHGISSTVINLFKNCQHIESLQLDFDEEIECDNLNLLLNNCCGALKQIYFGFYCIDSSEFFKSISNKLDLQDLTCLIKNLTTVGAIEDLITFIESLTNLEYLRLDYFAGMKTNLNFVSRMKNTLDCLKKLKDLCLDIDIYDFDNFEEYNWKTWDICNLKSFTITVKPVLSQQIVEKIFGLPSDNLEKLYIEGLELPEISLTTFPKNYRMLNSLSLKESRDYFNYESDIIFLILEHLKNLKYLNYEFPPNSTLNSEKFYTGIDLILPKIENVSLKLNKHITSEIFIKLIESVGNLTEFYIRFHDKKCNNFKYNIILDILTKELPNLQKINILSWEKYLKTISFLQKIKSNLVKFNNNPQLFRINWDSLDNLIKNATYNNLF